RLGAHVCPSSLTLSWHATIRFLTFCSVSLPSFFFLLIAPPPTHIYTLSLHDALPISFRFWLPAAAPTPNEPVPAAAAHTPSPARSEEHTSELQSRENLVCRLLLEKKKPDYLGILPLRFREYGLSVYSSQRCFRGTVIG